MILLLLDLYMRVKTQTEDSKREKSKTRRITNILYKTLRSGALHREVNLLAY